MRKRQDGSGEWDLGNILFYIDERYKECGEGRIPPPWTSERADKGNSFYSSKTSSTDITNMDGPFHWWIQMASMGIS